MIQLNVIVAAVFAPFFLMAVGYVVRRMHLLTAEADQTLLRLTINLLMPCLILQVTMQNEALKQISTIVLAPSIGFLTVVIGIVGCALYARWRKYPDADRRTFALATGLYNYGYLPLPMVAALYDQETTGVLFLFNLGVEMALWTVGLGVMAGSSFRDGIRRALNAPLVAIVCGLSLNLLGLGVHVPTPVMTSMGMLAVCAIPMGLLLTGATFADHRRELGANKAFGVLAASCVWRLILLPLVFIAAAFLPGVSVELKRVLLIQAAMPSAVFNIILAKLYNGNPGLALRIVTATTLGACITLPLILKWGSLWLNLAAF